MAKQEEVSVPIFSSLEPVYGQGSQLEEAKARFDVLKSKFNQVFDVSPQLFARSPGNNDNLLILLISCSVFLFVAWLIRPRSNDLMSLTFWIGFLCMIFEFRKSESDWRAHWLWGILSASNGYSSGHHYCYSKKWGSESASDCQR